MASEADDEIMSNLEAKSHLGAKAEAHIQKVPEATKESIPDAEDNPSNEFEEEGRVVVIAGQEPEHISDEDESVPFDIVAVQGIHRDRSNAQMTAETDHRLWDDWLHWMHSENPSSRIIAFDYDSSHIEAGINTIGCFKNRALQLLDGLVKLRGKTDLVAHTRRPIVFIAHGLGGTIVKMALWLAMLENSKFRDIKDSARSLIFFGCPHKCSSIEELENKIVRLLLANGNVSPYGIANTIRELARSINEINEAFFAFKIPLITQILSVYSTEQEPSSRIFDKDTSTLDIPLEKQIECTRPHKDMYKMAHGDDLYQYIDRQIRKATSRLRASDDSFISLRTLWSLAAPVFPIGRLAGSEHRFNWITAHEEYKAWINSQTPSVLHVHGTSNVPDASEFIFKCLNEDWDARQKNKIVTYFTFEKDDDRRNSTTAMLITLSTQILNECQSLHKAVRLLLDEMSHHCSWTKTDLLLLFRIILLSCENDGIVCIINSMSECDSSFLAFLEEICSLVRHTERRFKVAVTSTTNYICQSVLTGWPAINLDDQQEGSHTINPTLASGFDFAVLKLIQQHPEFYDFRKRITEKLSGCGQDRHWRRLILNQLKLSEYPLTRLAIARQLDVLTPTTPKEILFRILAGIPLEKQQWARKVLLWTLYSFHPLSVWELSVALVLQDECLSPKTGDIDEVVCQGITGELDRIFKGIFRIEHNEVRFSHPDARESLRKGDCSQNSAWYDLQETAQQQITEACFFYLSLPQVQRFIMTSYILPPEHLSEFTASVAQYSLCSYAIKYWPRHYKLIPKVNHPIESALKFCRNTKIVRTWIQAYWSLQKPIIQIDNVFSSPLPVLAGLGLQDLASKLLDPNAEPNDPEDFAKALTEAAQNTNLQIVRTLLSMGGYNQSNLEDALIAATSTCDEAVLNLLISHVGQRCRDFQWPPVLMCRAAQFGLVNVIKLLLDYGASLQAAITLHDLTPLHLAARHGHVEAIKILLANKASIIARDKDGLTPLLIAAKYNQTSVLSLLLSAYADCNAIDNDENTALIFACKCGSYTVVRMLLSKPECKIRHGKPPPLSIASYNGFYKCARLLLENKENIEIQKSEFTELLRHAVLNGHLELCQLLLECGADTNTPFEGNLLLSESIDAGYLTIIKALIAKGADINAPDSNKRSALQKASMKGDKELVAYLLDHGADINHIDDNDWTSTVLAANFGFAEIVQLLIDRGADPQHSAFDGCTPLHACWAHAETTHTLLKNGVDVNKVMNGHLTPLHIAASRGSSEVVKMILSYNPDLEVTTSSGDSALMCAAHYGETEVIRLLLEAGANINHQTNSKRFALQYAVEMNMEIMLRTLMEYNPEVDLIGHFGQTALHCLNSDSSVTIIKILVNGGADLNIRDVDQDTPICNAVWSSKIEVLEYLAKKAKLDIVGGARGGPLHIACLRSQLRPVKVLVDAGADVNLLDPSCGTPLQSACKSCRNSSKEEQNSVIFYLINEANVNLNIIGGLLGCAINAACGWSSFEVVKLMLEKGTRIDIRDPMGRMAIHFAAAASMESFQLILDSGADVEVADNTGRTALHWAAISGMAPVVNHIISLSRGLVDQIDNDGWSPLLWAARGCDSSLKEVSSGAQEGVIKLLLDRGADPCVTTKGLDRDWSPVKVARYHGVDSRIIHLLEEKAKEKLQDTGGVWDEEFHASRQADRIDKSYCDCCLEFLCGIRYHCETCFDFDLCYKCYLSRKVVHPPSHQFQTIGSEYLTESGVIESESDEEFEGDDEVEEEDDDE